MEGVQEFDINTVAPLAGEYWDIGVRVIDNHAVDGEAFAGPNAVSPAAAEQEPVFGSRLVDVEGREGLHIEGHVISAERVQQKVWLWFQL